MARRTRRMDKPWSIDDKLANMAKARNSMITIQAEVKINSDLYRAAGRAIDAIDDVATELTGKERVFWNLHD